MPPSTPRAVSDLGRHRRSSMSSRWDQRPTRDERTRTTGAIPMMPERPLEQLKRLVGSGSTEATHPALPGLTVHGTAVVEWLEGDRFLIHRARTDHADFPDSISIIGITDRDRVENAPIDDPAAATESRLSMHYFDSRGVFRVYDVGVNDQ